MTFERGVALMLDHIEAWRGAPVWNADAVAAATADWFRYLSPEKKRR